MPLGNNLLMIIWWWWLWCDETTTTTTTTTTMTTMLPFALNIFTLLLTCHNCLFCCSCYLGGWSWWGGGGYFSSWSWASGWWWWCKKVKVVIMVNGDAADLATLLVKLILGIDIISIIIQDNFFNNFLISSSSPPRHLDLGWGCAVLVGSRTSIFSQHSFPGDDNNNDDVD